MRDWSGYENSLVDSLVATRLSISSTEPKPVIRTGNYLRALANLVYICTRYGLPGAWHRTHIYTLHTNVKCKSLHKHQHHSCYTPEPIFQPKFPFQTSHPLLFSLGLATLLYYTSIFLPCFVPIKHVLYLVLLYPACTLIYDHLAP